MYLRGLNIRNGNPNEIVLELFNRAKEMESYRLQQLFCTKQKKEVNQSSECDVIINIV